MQNIVMGSLSGSQMIDGLNIYNSVVNAIGGSAAAKAALSKAMTVFGNNLQPLVTQVRFATGFLGLTIRPKISVRTKTTGRDQAPDCLDPHASLPDAVHETT